MEEREILGLDLVVLIDRADDVSGNCSNHISSSLCRSISSRGAGDRSFSGNPSDPILQLF
jgi:hypothetical protein